MTSHPSTATSQMCGTSLIDTTCVSDSKYLCQYLSDIQIQIQILSDGWLCQTKPIQECTTSC